MTTPKLSPPADTDRLRDYLQNTVCDPQAVQELREYLDDSFERFMMTVDLLPHMEGRVLELGATPYFTTMLMRIFRPGYELELSNFFGDNVADSDIIHEVVVKNAKYGERHALHYREFNVEAQAFPHPDRHFDGILFCEILEHLTRDPVAALEECHRVLKPGGWLLVTTPNFARYENLAKLWNGQNPSDQYSGYGPYGRHNREYTLSELKRLLEGVGFDVPRLEARAIHRLARRSRVASMLRILLPSQRHEEHLFCMASRGEAKADPTRPAWLYRSLPTDPTDPDSPAWIRKGMMNKKGMRISVVNLNLVAEDAIGACIINQVRFFRRRGDSPRVYVLHHPSDIPADVQEVTSVVTLKDLISGEQDHFRLSDLYVYHYPSRHDLMESIRGIDRGAVIFYYHSVTPPELWGSDADRELLVQGVEGSTLAHYADLCITPSPFNKRDLVDRVGMDPDRVHVLPLAVPLARFAPGGKDARLVQMYDLEGQRVLLFVGRMAPNKRIDLLVEALARIRGQVPNTKLLLVGDDRGAAAYRKVVVDARSRAEELGLAQSVIWTGPVDELPPYYHLADVCVSASLHEGFGMPLIEAMACGVPVVASAVGAMPWVVDDAGLVYEAGNVDELVDRVVQVLEDANLHQSLTHKGLARVQAFSLESYEAGLSELVDKAVTYTLPKAPPAPPVSVGGGEGMQAGPAVRQDVRLLGVLSNEIASKSDVALDGYVVRSKVPVLGPLIAWVRKNLTSHLREPYLDPMIERQVAFNVRAAEWVRRAAATIAAQTQRQAELEARVEALEAQVTALGNPLTDEEAAKEGEP